VEVKTIDVAGGAKTGGLNAFLHGGEFLVVAHPKRDVMNPARAQVAKVSTRGFVDDHFATVGDESRAIDISVAQKFGEDPAGGIGSGTFDVNAKDAAHLVPRRHDCVPG
jgi:hypothetical protein